MKETLSTYLLPEILRHVKYSGTSACITAMAMAVLLAAMSVAHIDAAASKARLFL